MSHQIYKYPIRVMASIDMPVDSEILTIQMQGPNPQMWVKVDPDKPMEERTFATYGTGHEMSDDFNYEYIDTFQTDGGSLVWHVFEQFPKVTADNVRMVREGLGLSMSEAKSLLEEHKGNVKSVFAKFGITKTFEEFQATRETGIIPEEVLGSIEQVNGYLYLDRQCAIIIIQDVPHDRYELIIGNQDTVSPNLEELERQLYTWAMSEGFE